LEPSLLTVDVQPDFFLPIGDRDTPFGRSNDDGLARRGRHKFLRQSTLIVRMFPSTVICTFFIRRSPAGEYLPRAPVKFLWEQLSSPTCSRGSRQGQQGDGAVLVFDDPLISGGDPRSLRRPNVPLRCPVGPSHPAVIAWCERRPIRTGLVIVASAQPRTHRVTASHGARQSRTLSAELLVGQLLVLAPGTLHAQASRQPDRERSEVRRD